MRVRKPYCGLLAACATLLSLPLLGQDYPAKPIRIVTSAPGGSSDFAARLIAQGMTAPLGQQVLIDNRTGATTGGDVVSRAAPDGYTLIYWGSTFWTLPLMRKSVPYDPVKDFAPITLAVTQPLMLVVHPSLPVRSARELIALAKARPGDLNYASGGVGSSNHLAAELFKSMAGVRITTVQYRGSGGGVTALLGGEVQLMFSSTSSVAPHVKSGRLRALAITSPKPSALAPNLPTVADSGLPGYEASQRAGLLAPAKTAAAIVNRLHQEVAAVLNRTEIRERLLAQDVEVVASSPAEFASLMKSEMSRMSKVINDAGIREGG